MNAGGVRRLGRDPVEIPLSLASMDIWQSLKDHIGDHVDAFHPCFYLKVALDEDGQALGADRINALQKAGFQHEIWLENAEIQRRLPHLSCPTYGGILVEGDGWALPWRIVQGLHPLLSGTGPVWLKIVVFLALKEVVVDGRCIRQRASLRRRRS